MKEIPNIPISNSECVLIFPFHHRFDELKQAEKADNWKTWLIRLNSSEKKDVNDATSYFQPSIRKTLFPEMSPPIKPQSTRHLTFMLGSEPFSCDFTLQFLKKDVGYIEGIFNAHISFIDAYIFDDKTGLLAININPQCDSLHQLVDFLRVIRMLLPTYNGIEPPHLNLSVFPNSKKIDSMNDFINFLLENIIMINFGDEDGRVENKQVYPPISKEEMERCYTFTYAQILEDENISKTDIAGLEMRDLWLYEIGTMTLIGSEDILNDEYVSRVVKEHRIDIWESCQGIALNNNVAFLEFSDSPQINKTFFHTITRDYFFLYIFCLCQKIKLLKLQDNLINFDQNVYEISNRIQDLLGQKVKFQNRFWLADVTKNHIREEIYKKCQYGLGTNLLYEYISNKIDDLYKYHCTIANGDQINQTLKLNRVIKIISAVLGIPLILISFLNINIRDYTNKEGLSLGSAFALLLGFIILGVGIALLINWRDNKKTKSG